MCSILEIKENSFKYLFSFPFQIFFSTFRENWKKRSLPLKFNSFSLLSDFEHFLKKGRVKTHEAIYSFVAVDDDGKPSKVPPLLPETEEEIERQKGAIQRKELSLIKAGKLDPKDAKMLKSMFE